MLNISFLEQLNVFTSIFVIISFFLAAFIVYSAWAYIAQRKNLMINFSDVDKTIKNHNELKNKNQALQDQNDKLKQNIQDLKTEENSLKNSVDVCKAAQTELNTIMVKYEGKLKELREIEQHLAKSQAVRDYIEQHKKEEIDDYDRLIEQKKQELRDVESQMDTNRLSEAIGNLCDLSADNIQLEGKREQLAKEIDSLEKAKSGLNKEISDLNHQVNKAQQQLNECNLESKITDSFTDLMKTIELQSYNAYLDAENQKLEQKLNQARSSKTPTEAYKALIEEPKYLTDFGQKFYQSRIGTNLSEIIALAHFRSFLKKNNLFYSARTIKAFHTSLKVQNVNPLSVLAGVSGTGKTQLAIQYATFFGLYCEHVAVQPRWDSKDDLLGFYNFLEQRFQPTKLATSLYWFDQNFKRPNIAHPMMLVILDEMNLARVEYYFSEFLSKLELRNTSRESSNSITEQSSITMGSATSNYKIDVDFRNVLFVGTMNEDESTFALSDKVLDRANVLHFGPPSQFGQDTREMNNIHPMNLDAATFANWCHSDPLPDYYQEKLNKHINDLNCALEKVGKGFGHRVNRSINEYVRLYPGDLDQNRFNTALSDQLEMKIIPKLAGLEKNNVSDESLDAVQVIINQLGDQHLSKSFAEAMDNFNTNSMFIWHGVKRNSADD